jgi:hypothetical protein
MIYVKTDMNGWPLERREEDWPEASRPEFLQTFETDDDLKKWIEAHREFAPVDPTPEEEAWRVSKDTMLMRVKELGALSAVMQLIQAQSPEDQFFFANSAWFWSNNEQIRGMIAYLGLDPDVIMDHDEFLR